MIQEKKESIEKLKNHAYNMHMHTICMISRTRVDPIFLVLFQVKKCNNVHILNIICICIRKGIEMKEKSKKFRTTLTIDEEIFQEAKKKIPNISKEFEDYLKMRLNSSNRNELVIREEILVKQNQIMELEQEIGFLQIQLNNLTGYNQDQKEQEGLAWRRLLSHYREYGGTHPKLMNPAIELLKVDEETLLYVLERVKMSINYKNAENMRDWDYVREQYIDGGM